jgi:DNA-binding LacI/PurR family transcriptional regulator
MRDVAKLSGVSISTVSRVINSSANVDIATRIKVEENIKKLRYKPNLLAKGLRIGSGNLIGLLVPDAMHYTFASFISYIEEYVTARDHSLVLGSTNNNPILEEKIVEDLIRRNVDGIIFSRVSDQSRVMRILNTTEVPVVIIDRTFPNEEIPTVALNNEKAGELAAEHLAELGHTAIACITGPMNISICRERLHGFVTKLKEYGVTLNERYIFEGNFKHESGLKAVNHFMESNLGITALWAQNDLMAIGAIKGFQSKGIRIPHQVSIIGMDDIELAKIFIPALTTIRQPFREMCENAVKMLLRETNESKKIIVEPTLSIRESTSRLGEVGATSEG